VYCCSHKESQENGSRHVGEVLAKENEWKESEHFTSENLSLMANHNYLDLRITKVGKLFASKPGKYGWHFWG